MDGKISPLKKELNSILTKGCMQDLNEKANCNLQKITEQSMEQNRLETGEFKLKMCNKHTNKSTQGNTVMANFNSNFDENADLKELNNIKRLIRFSFEKNKEAPTTTSEFYKIGRVIGKGAFGKVNLAQHRLSEQLVAIKSINKEFLKNEKDQKKKLMQEVGILKQSSHPAVVKFLDSFETSKHMCFVMEICSGGDLLSYVRKRRKLKEDIAKYFMK